MTNLSFVDPIMKPIRVLEIIYQHAFEFSVRFLEISPLGVTAVPNCDCTQPFVLHHGHLNRRFTRTHTEIFFRRFAYGTDPSYAFKFAQTVRPSRTRAHMVAKSLEIFRPREILINVFTSFTRMCRVLLEEKFSTCFPVFL